MSYIFVTGLYGTGKSSLAQLIARIWGKPLCPFDTLYGYGDDISIDNVYAKLSCMEGAVTDAIPIVYPSHIEKFDRFRKNHHVQCIIVTYCNLDEWLTNRLPNKLDTTTSESLEEFRGHFTSYYEGSFLLDYLDTEMQSSTVYYNTSDGSISLERPTFLQNGDN